MEHILNSLLSAPLQHRAGLRFTELGRSCSQILVNPTALFLSYLTVIKLVDLGFSSVMIFSSPVLIYLDYSIVFYYIVKRFPSIMAPVDGHETWDCLTGDILTVVRGLCGVRCLPQCCYSIITYHTWLIRNDNACHAAILWHKFYLIIKPYTHLVHLVIELCINFVYSIKN